MVYFYGKHVFGSKQSTLSDFSVFLYHFVVFSPCYFKQTISRKPYWAKVIPNDWFYIGHWSIANMLHQYHTNNLTKGADSEADVTVANGKPIMAQ